MALAADPLAELRTFVETVAQDAHVAADERALALQRIRDDLEITLGAVDSYLGRMHKRMEAEASVAAADVDRLRENAILRDEILRRGLATPEQLDEAGFLEPEEIRNLEEEGLLEATAHEFTGRLHPRDRKGRFRDTPDTPRTPYDLGDLESLFPPAPPSSEAAPDPGYPKKMRPARFSAAVQKINTAEDANAYLRGLGFEDSDLTGAKPDLSADWYRQVAQAVTDADKKFPQLRKGPYPFTGVRVGKPDDAAMVAVTRDEPDQLTNAFAFTGPDPVKTDARPKRRNILLAPRTVIEVMPDSESTAAEYDTSDFSTASASSIYGRTMHELGHAVDQASGFMFSTDSGNGDGSAEAAVMEMYGIGPDVVARLSQYAASAAAEGWAEIFSTLHTPHGLEPYPADLRKLLRDFQKNVNDMAGTEWGGPLL